MANTYQVTRSTTIAAPAADVFDRISKFSRWQEWSPWEDLDPDMTKTFSGNDGEVGSGYRWTGNRKAGAGSMAMTSVSAPTRVEADLQFLKPFKSWVASMVQVTVVLPSDSARSKVNVFCCSVVAPMGGAHARV